MTLPKWAQAMEPVGMNDAARLLGVCRRTLTETIGEHPHYEMRGKRKVFYPEHIEALRAVKWGSKSKQIKKPASSKLAAPSGAKELERARARMTAKRRRALQEQKSGNSGKIVHLESRK